MIFSEGSRYLRKVNFVLSETKSEILFFFEFSFVGWGQPFKWAGKYVTGLEMTPIIFEPTPVYRS